MNIWVQVSRVLESMEAPDRSSRYRPESRRLQQVVRHIICAVHEFQSIRAPASTLFLSGTEDPIKIAETPKSLPPRHTHFSTPHTTLDATLRYGRHFQVFFPLFPFSSDTECDHVPRNWMRMRMR